MYYYLLIISQQSSTGRRLGCGGEAETQGLLLTELFVDPSPERGCVSGDH